MRTLKLIEHTVWTFGVPFPERMRQKFIGLKTIKTIKLIYVLHSGNIQSHKYKKAHQNSL